MRTMLLSRCSVGSHVSSTDPILPIDECHELVVQLRGRENLAVGLLKRPHATTFEFRSIVTVTMAPSPRGIVTMRRSGWKAMSRGSIMR